MARILAALSGGVDSAVAAWLLREQGHDVVGAYMRTWMHEEGSTLFADCPWERDMEDARAVAGKIGIPFHVFNLIEDYRERVVDYLVSGYATGRTPNPDCMCNREIKFGVLENHATRLGCEFVATGHYVRRRENADGSVDALTGVDGNKDQSYFLALVRQENLRRALFPIGNLRKPEVRELARQAGLPNAERKDSQGICFLGRVPVNTFLDQYIAENPGPIVTPAGRALGTHRGLHRYTLGQRHGIGVPSNTDHKAYVVVAKDLSRNALVVAFDEPDAPGLWGREFSVRELHWTNRTLTAGVPHPLLGRPRYRDPAVAATLLVDEKDAAHAQLVFAEPQRALASGQIVALYHGDLLLGGAVYA
ncbi:MAG TPA: tRNA 2-thiouridine(34) synthase MnmA [Opitutales bacterium]|jgi:tRNA-specific 2-thiouridylase|nr:tRNA 2-thiouridine(34) synthase MnmA [Opitutales bacterium]